MDPHVEVHMCNPAVTSHQDEVLNFFHLPSDACSHLPFGGS